MTRCGDYLVDLTKLSSYLVIVLLMNPSVGEGGVCLTLYPRVGKGGSVVGS